MALRNIVEEGDPVLRKISKEVKEVTPRICDLLDDLVETMRDANGVGLAAPQVGVLRRVCVVEVDEQVYELINPVILSKEGDQYDDEGCLSVPGKAGRVHRPEKVTVSCLNRAGQQVTYEGEGLLARAFCHEMGHLDGILYIDKADDIRYLDEEE